MSDADQPQQPAAAAAATAKETFRVWQQQCCTIDHRDTNNSSNNNDTTTTTSAASAASSLQLRRQANDYFVTTLSSPSSAAAAAENSVVDPLVATLIEQLRPCFVVDVETTAADSEHANNAAVVVTVHRSQITYHGLSVIVGALEGILRVAATSSSSSQSASPAQSSSVAISSRVVKLLGNFLLAYVGPIQLHDSDQEMMSTTDTGTVPASAAAAAVTTLFVDEEEIRDLAIVGLTCLLSSSPACRTTDDGSNNDDDNNYNKIDLYLDLTQQGVMGRSQDPDMMDTTTTNNAGAGAGYEEPQQGRSLQQVTAAGLSSLPRSRRTLCFNLVETTIKTVMSIVIMDSSSGSNSSSSSQAVVDLLRLVIQCLQGESDPRCLIQLLRMMKQYGAFVFTMLASTSSAAASSSSSWFGSGSTNSDDISNSLQRELFDAVVPYYPIQFTPQPHHDITRSDLQCALLDVMCLQGQQQQQQQQQPGSSNNDVMFHLSLQAMIESIVGLVEQGGLGNGSRLGAAPNDNDNNIIIKQSCQEIIDSLNDLSVLLQLSPSAAATTTRSRCAEVTDNEIRQLADVLKKQVYDGACRQLGNIDGTNSASAVATTTTTIIKQLIDTCHVVVAEISYECEQLLLSSTEKEKKKKPSSSSLWQVFVCDTVHELARGIIATNDGSDEDNSNSSSNIAYIANLCSCGGLKTLQLCLEVTMNPLLTIVERQLVDANTGDLMDNDDDVVMDHDDKETTLAAIYGIGAIYSACYAALSKIEQRNNKSSATTGAVILTPHPLEPYATRTIETLCMYLIMEGQVDGEKEKGRSLWPIKTACVRVMESVLLATPAGLLLDDSDDAVPAVAGAAGSNIDQTNNNIRASLSLTAHQHEKQKLVEMLVQFIDTIAKPIFASSAPRADSEENDDGDNEEVEWLRACTKTTSCLMGHAIDCGNCDRSNGGRDPTTDADGGDGEDGNNSNEPILCVEMLNEHLSATLLKKFLASALTSAPRSASATTTTMTRYDWNVLSRACQISRSSARHIVQYYTKALYDALLLQQQQSKPQSEEDNDDEALVRIAQVLSFILIRGGPLAIESFHHRSSTTTKTSHPSSLDVITLLTHYTHGRQTARKTASSQAARAEATSNAASSKNSDHSNKMMGLSALQLPPTEEEKVILQDSIEHGYEVVQLLRPAYCAEKPGGRTNKSPSMAIPLEEINGVVQLVYKVLPPLSHADIFQCSMVLPFLSAALTMQQQQHSHDDERDDASNVSSTKDAIVSSLNAMYVDLAEFALSIDFHPIARAHAVSCLHIILAKYTSSTTTSPDHDGTRQGSSFCPAVVVLQRTILPSLETTVNFHMARKHLKDKHHAVASPSCMRQIVAQVTDCLSLISVIGSAAAQRGGVSSRTADSVVHLLIDLACCSKADDSFTSSSSSTSVDAIDLTVFDIDQDPIESSIDADKNQTGGPSPVVGGGQKRTCLSSTELAVNAATAIGAMLSDEGHQTQLWKQRLIHIAGKRIQTHYEKSTRGAVSIGLVAAACHLLCTANAREMMSQAIYDRLVQVIVIHGLSAKLLNEVMRSLPDPSSVKKLILASTIKILCIHCSSSSSPSASSAVVSNNIPSIISGVMRAYASSAATDPNDARVCDDIACKLLALQALEATTHVVSAKRALLALKPAVVSILDPAMNHPSMLLRHAAVEVRNAWFLLH